jgi:NAD(P)-dependent dehydrogenase (short-subunit alcohol dehydrogenase family)
LNLPFAGRSAIITGASRGIGLAIAKRLVDSGARVIVTGRGQAALEEAVDYLGGPARALGVAGKVDDPEHRSRVIDRALESFGRIDFLVNNAGINPAFGPLVEMDLDVGRKTFEVNCLAAVAWVQGVHSAWMANHGGSIVNLSSLSSIRSAPNIGFYGATKAMLNSLTGVLAVELGPRVRVNAVAPAVVKTQFSVALYEGREEAESIAYPLSRLGEPDDVAGVVSFLLSDDAAWMTGQTLVIDGGFSLRAGQG